MPSLSAKSRKLQASPIRKLAPHARAAEARGTNVIYLNIGQPDMPTPPEMIAELHGLSLARLAYAPSEGLPEAREAWSAFFASWKIAFAADEILVTAGASEAITFILAIVAGGGGEVLVFEPCYTNYLSFAAQADVTMVPITLKVEDGYHFGTIDRLRASLTPNTKAILLCNPSNPTGTVYTADELEAVAQVALENDLFVICDEVYREFVFGGGRVRSFTEFSDLAQRIIVVDSVSKRFNACGVRIGCMATHNREVLDVALRFCQARLSVPTAEQLMVVPMLEHGRAYSERLCIEYERRRDAVFNGLGGHRGRQPAPLRGLVLHHDPAADRQLRGVRGLPAARLLARRRDRVSGAGRGLLRHSRTRRRRGPRRLHVRRRDPDTVDEGSRRRGECVPGEIGGRRRVTAFPQVLAKVQCKAGRVPPATHQGNMEGPRPGRGMQRFVGYEDGIHAAAQVPTDPEHSNFNCLSGVGSVIQNSKFKIQNYWVAFSIPSRALIGPSATRTSPASMRLVGARVEDVLVSVFEGDDDDAETLANPGAREGLADQIRGRVDLHLGQLEFHRRPHERGFDEVGDGGFEGGEGQPRAADPVGVEHTVRASELEAFLGSVLDGAGDDGDVGVELARDQDRVHVVGVVGETGDEGLGLGDAGVAQHVLVGGVAADHREGAPPRAPGSARS